MVTLNVPVTTDFSAQTLLNIDRIAWTGTAGGNLIATFQSSQFGAGKISSSVILQGSSGGATNSAIIVNLSATGTFNAAGWGFVNWGDQFDLVQIFGTSGADTIIGTAFDDQIGSFSGAPGGSGGADSLFGGAGNDILSLTTANIAGAIYDGGAGTGDRILLRASTTYALDTTTITGVEELVFIGNFAILRGDQIGSGGGRISRIDFGGGPAAGEGITVRGSAINLSNLTYLGFVGQQIRLEGLSGTANSIIGSSVGEVLVGGTLNDTFSGNGGADTLDGGAGNDTFAYTFASEAATGESVTGGTGTADRLSLAGASYDLTGLAMTGVEVLGFGNPASSATLKASQLGGTGDITTVAGGAGVNSLIVVPNGLLAGQTISLAGIVFQSWTSGVDTITIRGTTLGDHLTGSGQDDTLDGGAGADTLLGGNGNDTYIVDNVGDVATDSGAGIDIVQASVSHTLSSAVENLLLIGNAASNGTGNALANRLTGNGAANSLSGQGGNDTLSGGAGADSLAGGAGTADVADYSASAAGVTVRLFNGTGQGGDAEGDGLSGVEGLTGSGQADNLIGADAQTDVLSGGAGNDFLAGLTGNDTLLGGVGDDTLRGGAGADRLDNNGGGLDFADYTGSAMGVTVRLFNGTGTGGDAQGDVLVNIRGVIGSDQADNLIGSEAVTGAVGDDALFGGGGNDVLAGLSGDNTLRGGAGADSLDGTNGDDIADYTGSAVSVTVRLFNGTGQFGDAQGDVLIGIEHLTGSDQADNLIGDDLFGGNSLLGGAGNDFLAGLGGADRLFGGAGNDTLDGGTGQDTLRGGAGADSLVGTSDIADYQGSATGVTVRLFNGTGQFGDAQGDVLTGIVALVGSDHADNLIGADAQADSLSGGAGNDFLAGLTGIDRLDGGQGHDTLDGGGGNDSLQGSLGHDSLVGGADNDLLDGGLGNDTLDGGTGNDLFVFSTGAGQDLVTLFQDGQDRVDLTGALTFAGLTETAIAGGVRVAVAAAPASFIDLMGVSTAQVDAGDFI